MTMTARERIAAANETREKLAALRDAIDRGEIEATPTERAGLEGAMLALESIVK